MKPGFSAVLSVLLATTAFAFPAGGWQTVSYLPPGINITDISFLDDGLHGMACGYLGSNSYVFHTTDGGQNWTASLIQAGHNLQGICVVNTLNAWTVGWEGTIYATADGGYTWTQQAGGTARDLLEVFFINPTVGWIAGGLNDGGSYLVLRTINGGSTWTSQSFGSDCATVECLYFADAFNGWIGGRSTDGPHIHHTIDGGYTWTRQTLPAMATSSSIRALSFANSTQGWATPNTGAASGTILHTSDGGATWASQYTTSKPYNEIAALDALNAVAVGSTPQTAYVTTDGGASWAEHPTGLTCTNTPVEFEAGRIWVGGNASNILASDDGGDSWTSQIATSPLISIEWADQNVGWAVAGKTQQGLTRRTTNGGLAWLSVPGNPGGAIVQFEDANAGWMLWDGNSPIVWRTLDGGTTWTSSYAGYSSQGSTYGMFFLGSDSGWVFGGHGIVRRSTNGGATWTTQSTGTTREVMDLVFTTPTTGWIAGGNGSGGMPFIRRTTNGGGSWQGQTTPGDSRISGLSFLDSNQGWAITYDRHILKTVDGGSTWTTTSQIPGTNGRSIAMVDALTGWATVSSGAVSNVYRTDDGGTTWVQDWATPTGAIQSRIAFQPDGSPWVCGDNMLIARWLPGTGFEGGEGGQGIEAGSLSISPNPASLAATVLYMASAPGEANLSIYDLSGRLVHEAPLGSCGTGENQFSIETGSYPSGLYFCAVRAGQQLITGSFLVVR